MEWYPWFPALYKADTMHLSAEQDGIYRRLIDHYMETRHPLPNAGCALARIAGVTEDIWNTSSDIILAFFTLARDGFLHHKRCDIELNRQDGKTSSHSERGKKGAEKRWKNYIPKQEPNGHSYALAMAKPMANDSRGEEKRGEEKKEYTAKFELFFSQFPKQRIGSKQKAFLAWKQAINRATEDEILTGLESYAKSDEVKRGFAKGAAAWLNDDRWLNNYSNKFPALTKPEPRYSDIKTGVITI